MGNVVRKEPCPKCREMGGDKSGDNLVIYEDESAYCFACGHTILSEEEKERRGLNNYVYEETSMSEPLTKEQIKEIRDTTGNKGQNSRGITDETFRKYGVRFEYDEESGEVSSHFYPVTTNYEISGFKIREIPKKFRSVGQTGKSCDAFGEWIFKVSNSKTVVIAAGECFRGDTEVMTEKGFIRFDELPKDVKVLQLHENKTGEFVTPLAYVEKEYSGDFIEYDAAKFSLHTTPDHNLVYWNNNGLFVKKKAKEAVSAKHFVHLSGKVNGGGTGLSKDQIALTLAICADSKYDVRKDGSKYVHFEFIKERKILRLRGILERLGITYTSYFSTRANGKVYTTFNFKMPSYITDKQIPKSWVANATLSEKDFILEELRWWDGNMNGDVIEFNSKHYSECSTIQELCVTSGRYSRIRKRSNKLGTWYVCSVYDRELTGSTQVANKVTKSFTGKVYCVTVPTGMIQVRHNGKVAIVGNCDTLSAYQMLENYRKGRNSDFEPTPVVSSTIGETGSDKQFQKRYNWLNRFDKIVICPDQDEAGKKAVEALVKVLPKNKVYVMELPMKDSNDMLTSGREKEWINAYFKAKQYTPAGIVSSEELYKEVVERAKVNKLPFPPMLEKANKVLAGGVNFGYICNIIAGSGSGKSSLINQCVKYWMTDLDMNVGVVSLEAEAGEFAENLLSHEMGRKIALIKDKEERISFVESEEAKQAAYNMFHRPDGSSRLFLLDDRGDFSMLQEKIEELIIACNCKIIVIDVISDILMPMPLDEVEKWMGWTKRIVKQYNCIFFHVSHVRKAGGGEKTASSGAFLTEESTIGSGSQFRSAGVNIALQRDKNNEDEVIRNTTSVHILKSRATGWTGKACELYYDSESHTLWDKDEYFSSRGGVFQ